MMSQCSCSFYKIWLYRWHKTN